MILEDEFKKKYAYVLIISLIIIAILSQVISLSILNNPIIGLYYDGFINLTILSAYTPRINLIAPITAHVGDHISLFVIASDTDNNTLFYSDNCNLFNIDNLTGQIDFTATSDKKGHHNCTIFVTDTSNTNST